MTKFRSRSAYCFITPCSRIFIRTVYSQVPPKVVYEISELGMSLKSLLDQLGEWGERYMNQFEWRSSCSE
ncbi:transcriptional regulator [Paenibacillus xerothermodurans]|uniref:Transcriptional regulator n=1 Tax=Paenibacillus xerothermodurans TaxID=1977292 RepID=A0A2W1N5D4_PAEXE|nr:transcriptional regulator [Paenibacillus xerothermodurans]